MIETLDVVSGRRKAKMRRDTWVGPSCSLAQSSCASTAGQCLSAGGSAIFSWENRTAPAFRYVTWPAHVVEVSLTPALISTVAVL
jgi:hypothetical protein